MEYAALFHCIDIIFALQKQFVFCILWLFHKTIDCPLSSTTCDGDGLKDGEMDTFKLEMADGSWNSWDKSAVSRLAFVCG